MGLYDLFTISFVLRKFLVMCQDHAQKEKPAGGE